MAEQEQQSGYFWIDTDMPGYGVEDHGKHGYHPVRIIGTDEHGFPICVQLGPKSWDWSGYQSRSQAWRFIQRKYFPKAIRLRTQKPATRKRKAG